MKFICLNISTIILLSLKVSFAQDNALKETRFIVVNYPDSVVNARILTTHGDIKPVKSKFYYWYMSDVINVNQGGFSGYLLNGDYSVYDRDKRLIVQGSYLKGLKTGPWKRWNVNGNLLKLANWDKGLLDGISTYYSSDGKIIMTSKYIRGKLKNKDSVEKGININRNYRKSEKMTAVVDSTDAKPKTKVTSK